MGGLFDYLDWRGELSLAQSPFNPVDNLLLSTLSYAPLDHLVDQEGTALWAAAERWEAAGGVWPPRPERGRGEFREEVLRLFGALARAPRFSGLMLRDWASHLDAGTEEQFAALTIDTGDGARFVSYRGTDSTLVGWKEDFNMSYQTPVPAQRSAAEYLSDALRRWGGPLRLGGHSKGGNLAVYAAAACRTPDRLLAVYNNDGPGFCAGAVDEAGYEAVRGRIHTFVPQSSVVGMLLDHEEDYTVVRSDQSGLFQHSPFSWKILGPDFVEVERVTDASRFVSRTLKEWVASLTPERREQFVDLLFEVLGASGAQTTAELSEGGLQAAAAGLRRLRALDGADRLMLFQALARLAEAARNSMGLLRGEET